MVKLPNATDLLAKARRVGRQLRSKPLTMDDVFKPGRRYCFLAGSGVSLDPPSCLPTGYKLSRMILERCTPDSEHEKILDLMNPERQGMRSLGDFLRFEELMEYLFQSVDPDLHALDVLADCQMPNLNHQFLAQMILRGHPVLTTNFDHLIELALIEAGIQRSQICPLISRQDWEVPCENTAHVVYKLHGSLIDIRTNTSCRESLQATLEQISRGKDGVLQLEAWKRVVLTALLQEFDLVVLGYSGLDDFDILPTLLNIPSDKNIIWINHDNQYSPADAQINSSKEFTENRQPDRVGHLLGRFSSSKSRLPERVIRVDVNTRKLLEWMAPRFLREPLPTPKSNSAIRKSAPEAPSISIVDQWLLAGRIYHDRNLLSDSLKAYEAALALAEEKNMRKKITACLVGMAHLLNKLGRMDEAFQCNLRCVDIAKSSKDPTAVAIALNEIGMYHFNRQNFSEADKILRQALKTAKELEDRRWEARTLNNYALLQTALHNFEMAKNAYSEAVTINDQIGDIRAKGTNYANLGLLARTQFRSQEAIFRYKQVIELADQIGDLMKKAMALADIGQILDEQGSTTEALEYFHQALQISEKMEMPEIQADRLFELAEHHYKRRQKDEALDYCRRSLKIHSQIDVPARKAAVLGKMGVIYHNKRCMDDSLKAFEEALALLERCNDPGLKCGTLSNFAFMLYDKGQKAKALDMLGKAGRIARQLEHPGLMKYVREIRMLIDMGG